MSLLLRSLTVCTVALALVSASATPAEAINTKPEFIAGLTLASIGGAGAIVSGIGSFAYIAHREYTRGWGWLSLLTGGMTMTGGLLMAAHDEKAQLAGGLLTAFGIASIAVGIVGLTLQGPEAKLPRAVQIAPVLLTTPRGTRVAALAFSGVF